MNLENIKKIQSLIKAEINTSFSEIGSNQMRLLCQLHEINKNLISCLEDPKEYQQKIDRVNKSMNLGDKK